MKTTNPEPVPTLPPLTPEASALLSTYPAGLNPGLAHACAMCGITSAQISRRYSDAYIVSAEWSQLATLKRAGIWRSMAELTRMNPDHPDAKKTPYLLDVPFAFLDAIVAGKVPKNEGF